MIELLVVIAIIGILSSIVLVALRGARNKAKDARIVADLTQVRSIAEVLYDGDYGDLALTQTDIAKLVTDIDAQLPSTAVGLVINKTVGDTEYCAYSDLNVPIGAATNYYCVDSLGIAGFTTTNPAAGTACPAGTI